jgi:hypothetical protein
MPGKKRKADKKAGFGQGSGSDLVDASIAADPLRNLPQIVKIELRKMLGKKDGGNMKKMTPKLQKKMEEIMEELGMMSPRIKPVKKKDGGSVRKQNIDLIVAFEEGKKKRRQKKERTGNPKVDKLMEEFEDVKGYKFGDNIGKKDGGLAEAIKKVKAKEMKEGGSVGDKLREEVSKSRRGKAGGSISMKEMDRIMRKVGIDSGVFEKPDKKAKGGPIRGRRPKAFRSRLDDAVEEFIETIEPFQGTVRKGETLRNIDGKTMIIRKMPNPNFSGNTISDRDRKMVGAMLGEGGRMISDADRRMVSQMMGARKMEDGGVVPAKFKGFSKLPEDVQQKMNPTLAKKFKKGGPVKMGSGGGVCRGMGAARAGGKFKLR